MRKTVSFSALIVCMSAGHLVAGDSQVASDPVVVTPRVVVAPQDAVTSPKDAVTPQVQATPQTTEAVRPSETTPPPGAATTAKPAAAAPHPAMPAPASPPVDSGKRARDSLAIRDSAATAAQTGAVAGPADSATSSPDTVQAQTSKGRKRKRIVRETTVNTIDELKGRYRSPKRALFMSLVVPGLGQAYVGQHWINYTRGAAYFLADVALAYGWHYYVVDKQDRQIVKYQRFADQHWRQSKYEDTIAGLSVNRFADMNSHRESYCDAVQQREGEGNKLFLGCRDREKEPAGYQGFQLEYNDKDWSEDSVSHRRAQFNNSQAFYELIGKEVEFITGWDDANNIQILDSSIVMVNPDGTIIKDSDGRPREAYSDNQQKYVSMRDRANQYARMQSYFLGGIVLNHIVSALDAALAARFHNKALYQTEVRWYDRVRLESDLAWEGVFPRPTVMASLTF